MSASYVPPAREPFWRSAYLRAQQWLFLLFRKPEEPAAATPSLPEPAMPTRPKKARKDDTQHEGEFYFRDAILDQLPVYFDVMRRMRRGDRDAYNLYSKLGAHVIPMGFMWNVGDDISVSRWWHEKRPAFGAVCFVHPSLMKDEREKRAVYPRFFYFSKYNRRGAPAQIQRINTPGDVYKCAVYWDQGQQSWPTEFAVLIGDGGEVTVLRTRHDKRFVIRAKQGPDKGRAFTVHRKEWEFGEFYEDWAREADRTVEHQMRALFLYTASFYESANLSMIRVQAEKGNMRAVFGVDILRTPYFFRDREVRIGETGHRKKIFHIVRTHQRANGSFVKSHFRGERVFMWNSYRIKISVPIKDHLSLTDFDVHSYDSDELPKLGISDGLGTAAVARLLDARINPVPPRRAE